MTEPRSGPLIRGAIASAIWVLSALSVAVGPDSPGVGVGQILGTALIGLVAGVATGYALGWALSRCGRRPGRGLHAIMRSVAGATAGLVFALLLQQAGGALTLPPAMLVAILSVATPWLIDAMEQVARAREEILHQREGLVSEAADLIATSAAETAIITDIRATIMTAVGDELAPARADVARQLAALETGLPTGARGEAAGQLRDVAHDSLRPLIQTLDATREAQAVPVGLLGTIGATIRTQPFHPAPLAMIYVLATLPEYWARQSPAHALASVGIGTLAIFGILGAGNVIMRRGLVRHDIAFITTLIVLQIPTVAYAIATVGGVDGLLASVTSVILSSAMVLVTSSLGSWRNRQEAAQRTFRELLDSERIDTLARARVTAEVTRQAAQTLHGSVQSRLAACAVALDEAARSGDSPGQIDALRNAEARRGS